MEKEKGATLTLRAQVEVEMRRVSLSLSQAKGERDSALHRAESFRKMSVDNSQAAAMQLATAQHAVSHMQEALEKKDQEIANLRYGGNEGGEGASPGIARQKQQARAQE